HNHGEDLDPVPALFAAVRRTGAGAVGDAVIVFIAVTVLAVFVHSVLRGLAVHAVGVAAGGFAPAGCPPAVIGRAAAVFLPAVPGFIRPPVVLICHSLNTFLQNGCKR